MNRKSKFTAETQRHKEKSQFEPFKLLKPIKPLLKTLCLSASVVFSLFLLFAGSANAIECKIIEPGVLKRYIENKSIYNMVMFDIRPRFDANMKSKFDLSTNMKRIPWTIWASVEDIEKELIGKTEELIGKDIVLVGENTESADSACKNIVKKKYEIHNIYVLKGGVEKWDGPVVENILTIECKMITSPQLLNIIKSNKKVDIIDQRTVDEYHEEHIPGARLQNRERKLPSIKSRLQKNELRKKWEQENTAVVYVYPNEFQAMRDCIYAKYFSWGYKDIYVLRGGMKTWEGEVERDYLEILKKKAKEYLK